MLQIEGPKLQSVLQMTPRSYLPQSIPVGGPPAGDQTFRPRAFITASATTAFFYCFPAHIFPAINGDAD